MTAEAAIDPPQGQLAAWRELVAEGRGAVLALILLGCWVVAADSLVTATIMPSVGAALDGFAWFGWAGSSFMTGLVVAGATAGWLAERIGLRAAMVLSGTVFALGCGLSAAAPNIGLFLAGRALQGAAAGWIGGLIYVAMAVVFEGRHLPRVFALGTSVWGIATFTGPLLGGLFADAGMWRGVFWLFAGQALLFVAASSLLIPRAQAADAVARLPWATMLLVTLGIAAVATAGVVPGGRLSALLALGGGALLGAALAADRASPHGLLPRGEGGFPLDSAYLVYFATNAAAAAFALYAPAMLQFSAGLSALEAGYLVAVEALAWTAASLAGSGASAAWRGRLIVGGAASIVIGTLGVTLLMDSGNLVAIGIAAASLGAGFGLAYPHLGQKVIGSFGPATRARGSAAIGAVRNAGGAVGAALAGLAANAAGFGAGLSASNFSLIAWAAFGIGIPFAVAALLAALRVVRPAALAQAGLASGVNAAA